jgi:hypothetical protein
MRLFSPQNKEKYRCLLSQHTPASLLELKALFSMIYLSLMYVCVVCEVGAGVGIEKKKHLTYTTATTTTEN